MAESFKRLDPQLRAVQSVVVSSDTRDDAGKFAWSFGSKDGVLAEKDIPMEPLAKELLSAALRVMWEHGHSEDQRAVELIAQRVPGFSAEQCDAASRRAAEMDRTAYELAAAWFASMGSRERYPTVDELEQRCPGFSNADYVEAISKNILWARK